MGLLDDAIREHLELRRRHGTDPGEVARQEHEALGRVRRGEAPVEEADRAEDDGGAVAAALGGESVPTEPPVEEPDPDAGREPVSDPEPEPSQPVGEPEAPVAPPVPPDEGAERFDAEALDLDAPPAPEPPPELPPTPPAPERSAPEVDRPAPDDEAAGEDVLEETPDFLQETPEHDRLWFEQKPPRDFEF